MEKRCFLFGHRVITEPIEDSLEKAIDRSIVEFQITKFMVGNYGEFDKLCARKLQKAKEKYPHIHIYSALAYYPEKNKWKSPEKFDGFYFPDGQERVPPKAAIPKLNSYLVDTSDLIICYVSYISNGAYSVLRYAQKKSKRKPFIINLGDIE